jgi:hypothetical protein
MLRIYIHKGAVTAAYKMMLQMKKHLFRVILAAKIAYDQFLFFVGFHGSGLES